MCLSALGLIESCILTQVQTSSFNRTKPIIPHDISRNLIMRFPVYSVHRVGLPT